MTSVKELIEKLQKCPQDLPVIIDPYYDKDTYAYDIAENILKNKGETIHICISQAESNRDIEDIGIAASKLGYIEYGFEGWIDPIEKQPVVYITNDIGAKDDLTFLRRQQLKAFE